MRLCQSDRGEDKTEGESERARERERESERSLTFVAEDLILSPRPYEEITVLGVRCPPVIHGVQVE